MLLLCLELIGCLALGFAFDLDWFDLLLLGSYIFVTLEFSFSCTLFFVVFGCFGVFCLLITCFV